MRFGNLFQYRRVVINPAFADFAGFIKQIPLLCNENDAQLIRKARNTIWLLRFANQNFVVKQFAVPSFINKLVYGLFRASKAKRSYDNAMIMRSIGVGSPMPVAYINIRVCGLFMYSYYVTLASECQRDYQNIFGDDNGDDVLREIARQTAILHENGMAHKDYGRGNIMYRHLPEGGVSLDIIDLNRMYFGPLDIKLGCKNFERLPATEHMHRVMAEEYARCRNFDAEECYRLMREYRLLDKGKEEI